MKDVIKYGLLMVLAGFLVRVVADLVRVFFL